MALNKSEVDLLASNGAAIKNGEDLAKKKRFTKLYKTCDDLLLFGECLGSGKNPYVVSVDFIDEKSPVFRCSCPSRQIPCKHALGLLYSFVNGAKFLIEDIPEDIAAKRRKIENKNEKKKETKENSSENKKTAMTKSQKAALIKKIDIQLQGIDIAEKIVFSIVNNGLASINGRDRKIFEDQIKQLGNYYISGIQTAISDFFLKQSAYKENDVKTINQIIYTYSLIKQGRDYLINKKDDPEKNIDLSSSIEEQMGYAWKLSELNEYGLKEENVKLIQLGFYSYDDYARKEYIDEGYFISLNSGKLYKTKNYRPYKASKYIKEDDSIFSCLEIDELFIYPGAVNMRIRWDSFKSVPIEKDHIESIKGFATKDFLDLTKWVKNVIKNPLSAKNPIAIIKIDKLKKAANGERYIAFDDGGNSLILSDISFLKEGLTNILENLLSTDKNLYMAVMFEGYIEEALLIARPLSVIEDDKVLRILY